MEKKRALKHREPLFKKSSYFFTYTVFHVGKASCTLVEVLKVAGIHFHEMTVAAIG